MPADNPAARRLQALAAEFGKQAVERAIDAQESLYRAEQYQAQRTVWARRDRRN